MRSGTASVNEDQRKRFNQALDRARASLQQIAKPYGAESKEYKKAEPSAQRIWSGGTKKRRHDFRTTESGNSADQVQTEGVKGRIIRDNPTGQNIDRLLNLRPRVSLRQADAAHQIDHARIGSKAVKRGIDLQINEIRIV